MERCTKMKRILLVAEEEETDKRTHASLLTIRRCCCCNSNLSNRTITTTTIVKPTTQQQRRKHWRNRNPDVSFCITERVIRTVFLLFVVVIVVMSLFCSPPPLYTQRRHTSTIPQVSSFSFPLISSSLSSYHPFTVTQHYCGWNVDVRYSSSITTTTTMSNRHDRLSSQPSNAFIVITSQKSRRKEWMTTLLSATPSSSSSSSIPLISTENSNSSSPSSLLSKSRNQTTGNNISNTNASSSSSSSSKNPSTSSRPTPRQRRVIPPTELELQQLQQIRQEAYEKICGPHTPIIYNEGNEEDNGSISNSNMDPNITVLIDTGATYNATKEFIFDPASAMVSSSSSSSSASTITGPTANNSSGVMPIPTTTTIVANTSILDNVYVQVNTTVATTIAGTNTNSSNEVLLLLQQQQQQGSSLAAKTKKSKPVSIWSFESLFPEPVLDTESIEKDLYRNINRTVTTTTTSTNNRNQTAIMLPISTTSPNFPTLIDSSNDIPITSPSPSTTTTATTKSPSPLETFLYGGSGIIRKEKKLSSPVAPKQQQSLLNQDPNNRRTATSTTNRSEYTNINDNNNNNNSTGKVDPLLTRMVEDRVYGYRRLPTGILQYDTSLIGPDSAIQFRNGVRLGNPLPINADILSYLAKKELQRGHIEEACELYEKAVTIDPADGRAYLGLSKCAERRRDFTLARKWLIQGINRSVSVQQLQSPTTKQVSNASSSPSSNKNNRNTKESEDRYTETTTLIPDRGANPYLLQALGCLEEKLGRLTQAETLFAEAVKSRPYHTAAWVSLAVLRTRKLGYPVRVGRECFQCAERELQIAQQPPSSFIYTSWANLEYHKANDKNRARELFQKAIQIDPQCSAAWLQLGVLEAACENWDAAELCFDTVLKFDQRNTRVLQAYAIMETKRPSGDSRKAIGLFERAIQTNPRDAGVYQPYALYVAELGDIKMARSLLHKGTQVNKRHAAVWQAWGVLETRYGDADTARKIFQEGIWACGQLSGSQSGGYHCDRLWQAWGVLEANEKDYAAARRCFNRALDANNRNVPAFTAWALMEEQLGNVKDARMIFERGLRKFSTGSEEKKALYRSYELMEQRLGDTTAAQNIYQRSVRESFIEKDEVDILKTNVILDTRRAIDESYSSDTTSVQPQTTIDKKKTKEFEVIRWENTGGEVWLNDRAIEAKVSITNKKKSSRDGRNKDTISNK